MSALADPTKPSQTAAPVADRLSALRSRAIVPVMMTVTGAAMLASGPATADTGATTGAQPKRPSSAPALLGGVVDVDSGTRLVARYDYRPMISGTSLASVVIDGPVEPFVTPTRMARIRAVAPLSFRDWAAVFGVSHSAVKQWADGEEPNRPKLDRILDALTEAQIHQHDVAAWLTTSLPGMDVRPIDLLRDERWRALRGAMRARSGPSVTVAPQELVRRRRAQSSWVVAEPATLADEA